MPTCITEGCKHKLPNDADIYNATVITAADISPLRDITFNPSPLQEIELSSYFSQLET